MSRYTVEIGERTEALLETLSLKKGIPKGEVIRYALAVYVYLSDEVSSGNYKVSVTDLHDLVCKDISLP